MREITIEELKFFGERADRLCPQAIVDLVEEFQKGSIVNLNVAPLMEGLIFYACRVIIGELLDENKTLRRAEKILGNSLELVKKEIHKSYL